MLGQHQLEAIILYLYLLWRSITLLIQTPWQFHIKIRLPYLHGICYKGIQFRHGEGPEILPIILNNFQEKGTKKWNASNIMLYLCRNFKPYASLH
jgi:hypothetical protein